MLPESQANTPLLEAAAMSGAHFRRCGGCGTIICTQNPELFTEVVESHACPAGPLDVIVDRVFSIGGLVSLVVISTVAALLGRLL